MEFLLLKIKICKITIIFTLLIILSAESIRSQDDINPDCDAIHNIGKFVLKTNSASFLGGKYIDERRDCLFNKRSFDLGAEYPKNSNIAMLAWGFIGVGGILDNDTIVNFGIGSYAPIFWKKYRSTLDPNSPDFEGAVSEQDYISVSVDNIFDPLYNPYNPITQKTLNIQVTNKSYSWSYEYAEDFVLFDIEIKNIGNRSIKNTYIGILLYFAVGYPNYNGSAGNDELSGFHKLNYSLNSCNNISENLLFMWGADNDGDPINGEYSDKLTFINNEPTKSATSVSGVFFLDHLSEKFQKNIKTSYNWWAYDKLLTFTFGPQSKEHFRFFDNHNISRPITHGDYYHILSNGEVDYDQIYTASISQYDPVWTYPDQIYAKDISKGQFLKSNILSVGPFDIPPGGVLKIPFAYVAGENFHTKPDNIDNLPDFPKSYYKNLDFSDLAKNAQWARWIYDNPGVDTDGDGYSGSYTICILDSQFVNDEWKITAADTVWYSGDGVPDWKAAGPPPAPYFWLEPKLNGIKVRFNGSRSETEKDIFTRIADFEGYNIYLGRDERESSLSLVSSYDKKNYDKFVYNSSVETYIVDDIPMTLEQIRCAYADSCNDEFFEPLLYSRTSPLYHNDSLIFFTKHSFNTEQSAITKVYPNARDPRLIDADSLVDADYTEDGYFKFFEYEYTIENLLPSVGYWVNVTVFDFGSPKSGLKALESSKTLNIQQAYPLMQADELSGERKDVYVYPNPYRIDADYRSQGYEGRTEEDRPDYRVRALNFANLPPKCEIKIFSLDGDLIRHLSHDIPNSDPTFSHERWNLITRNTQMIVSGLYYWTVEFPDGQVQMGKFVVIM